MIRFEQVTKQFPNGTVAVKELSLEVEEGETLVLLGTSGCGKTTTLRMVNRLTDPTSGSIYIDNENIMEKDLIELRRHIGYAIQHIGLFPHMTVAENIGVVPRLVGWDEARIADRARELTELMGLDPDEVMDRFPDQLSGGQKQRIGVARSLAADPPLILMDEPFGALDPITREQLQNEFLDLESEIEKTILFVTHDLFEAVKMGDRIALIDGGEVQQLATPSDLVDNPANEFVDQFLGQHRFQLSLLTRAIRSVLPDGADQNPPPERPKYWLPANHSLVEALDLFKTSGKKSLPVYKRQQFLGWLNNEELARAVSDVLGGLEAVE